MTFTDVDRYGGNVAVVVLKDGTNVNKEMVNSGFAWWYYKYSNDRSYEKLEIEARNAKCGLSADKNPTPPWECGSQATNNVKQQLKRASNARIRHCKGRIFVRYTKSNME